MTAHLAPYADYKDSGAPWLGAIPAHWEEKRAKFVYREVDERSQTGNEELLSVSHVTGVTPRSEKTITMFKAESYEGHKLCRPGDLVVNTMWAWMAALGVSRHTGIVSPSYAVYRPFNADSLLPEYADQLLRTWPYKAEYHSRSTGIRASRLRLYPDQFLDIPILRPPLEEQEAILAYLRLKNSEITRLIRAKRRLIDLLTEQKQAIIHRAVTRGLDPTVRLKDSRVAWLGEVPEHWEISRVKREFWCLDHKRVPLSSDVRGAMKARTFDYYGASGIIDKVDEYLFDDELVLLAEDGANLVLRNLPLTIVACGKFWVNNHAHVLKPKRGNLEFLAKLLETIDYRPWITGAAQPKLTGERLLSITIPVPPPYEQHQIQYQIEEETRTIRQTIDRARREIDLIREYRTRLIADVVTGKLDVRGVELPAHDEPVPLYDLDTAADTDEDDLLAAAEEEAVYALD